MQTTLSSLTLYRCAVCADLCVNAPWFPSTAMASAGVSFFDNSAATRMRLPRSRTVATCDRRGSESLTVTKQHHWSDCDAAITTDLQVLHWRQYARVLLPTTRFNAKRRALRPESQALSRFFSFLTLEGGTIARADFVRSSRSPSKTSSRSAANSSTERAPASAWTPSMSLR